MKQNSARKWNIWCAISATETSIFVVGHMNMKDLKNAIIAKMSLFVAMKSASIFRRTSRHFVFL